MTSPANSPVPESSTAFGVLAVRAAHLVLDDPPPILDDVVALRLLGPGAEERIRSRADALRTPHSLGFRAHILLRSRYAEDRAAEAWAAGVRQHVSLGAGFDTFAYRQPDSAAGVRFFELDRAATQAAKRARLERAGITIPANLSFVGADLDADFHAALARAGFDSASPAFVSCLGVSMYLAPETLDRVLRCVAGLAPGSRLVMTFTGPPRGADRLAEGAALAGEPWLSRFEPPVLESKMRGFGFSQVAFLAPEDAQDRYFKDRMDGLRAPHRENIVTAAVPAARADHLF